MTRIGVNGYGTIGKRVADAVREQPDMETVGIAKARPNHTADYAYNQGYDIYVPDEASSDRFSEAGIESTGSIEDLIERSEIVVDTTPAGMGAEYRPVYEEYGTPAIFQGGEEADVGEVSFTARASYNDAVDADYVRIVSCNTTGLNRLFAPLLETYGIEKVVATLVRCRGEHAVLSADPVTLPSHHGPDVQEVLPDIEHIQTLGMKAPTVRHHMHGINVSLEEAPDSAEEVCELLSDESRIHLIPGALQISSGWDLQEYALDRGRSRMNLYENQLWEDSITIEGNELYCLQSIHRESDVVPENIDAIRAMTGTADAEESIRTTNEALGIGEV